MDNAYLKRLEGGMNTDAKRLLREKNGKIELMVFHSRFSPRQIVDDHGFGFFKLNFARCKGIGLAALSPIGGASHNGLTLVGEVVAIEDAPEGRKFVRCDRFLMVDLENIWPAKSQFPVAYLSWDEIFKDGLTPDQLQWKTREEMMALLRMPVSPSMFIAATPAPAQDAQGMHRLTLAAAKAIIAAHLQTIPDAITIEI